MDNTALLAVLGAAGVGVYALTRDESPATPTVPPSTSIPGPVPPPRLAPIPTRGAPPSPPKFSTRTPAEREAIAKARCGPMPSGTGPAWAVKMVGWSQCVQEEIMDLRDQEDREIRFNPILRPPPATGSNGSGYPSEIEDAVKARAKSEWIKLSGQAKIEGCKRLKGQFPNDPTIQRLSCDQLSSMSFNALFATVAAAAGTAACLATGVGAGVAPLCGALASVVAAYFGDDIKRWASEILSSGAGRGGLIGGIIGGGNPIGAGIGAGVGAIGDLF